MNNSYLLIQLLLVTAALLTALSAAMIFKRRFKSGGGSKNNKKTTAERRTQFPQSSRNEFLSGMSHELRTPLNGIIGMSHLIFMHADEPDKIRLYSEKTLSSARYLLTLVDDLLDLSKFRDGSIKISKRPFDLTHLTDSVYEMMSDSFSSRGVSFSVDREMFFDCIVGDESRLKQVIVKLLSLSAKRVPTGGRVRLSVIQKPGAGCVITTFSVEDTGNGMSPEQLKKIFCGSDDPEIFSEPWLGLSVCRMLVKAMGGEITAESRLGDGTAFSVTLPSELCGPAPDEIPCTEKMDPSCLGATRILVAEDNELNAEIISEILSAHGFPVTVVKDGLEAVGAFERSPSGYYRIILMDLQMPKMNGWEAAEKIRSLDRPDALGVLIFACTANALKEDRETALASGMNDFLTKPVDVTELLNKLCEHIEAQTEGVE